MDSSWRVKLPAFSVSQFGDTQVTTPMKVQRSPSKYRNPLSPAGHAWEEGDLFRLFGVDFWIVFGEKSRVHLFGWDLVLMDFVLFRNQKRDFRGRFQ